MLQPLDLQPNGYFKREFFKCKQYYHREDLPEDSQEYRNNEMMAAKRALSVALSEHVQKSGWERTGLWPVDRHVALKSKMVKADPSRLPAVPEGRKKRKLGPKFTGIDLTNADAVVLEEQQKKEA